MPEAKKPENEKQRLQAVQSYEILDTLSETEYDNLVNLASFICDTPISLISIIDDERQWFKAKKGLEANETGRELAFCGHAILDPHEVLIVEDATQDDRFSDNSLVTGNPNIRFYAGCPLNTPDGFSLGTLCAIDTKAKQLSPEQVKALKILAENVVTHLELRKTNSEKEKLVTKLNKTNSELEEFVYRTSHDLRAPIASSIGLVQIIKKSIENKDEEKALRCLSHFDTSLNKLLNLINDLLTLTKAKNFEEQDKEININHMLENVLEKLEHTDGFQTLKIEKNLNFKRSLTAKKMRLELILENLISNAIKYQDPKKDDAFIKISTNENNGFFTLKVEDNGIGIPIDQQDKIFSMFERFHPKVSYGTGLGLYMIKKSADILGGNIVFEDTGDGSIFTLTVPIKKED